MLVEPQAPYSEVSLTQISTSACFSFNVVHSSFSLEKTLLFLLFCAFWHACVGSVGEVLIFGLSRLHLTFTRGKTCESQPNSLN